jgi:hypothetical protein
MTKEVLMTVLKGKEVVEGFQGLRGYETKL